MNGLVVVIPLRNKRNGQKRKLFFFDAYCMLHWFPWKPTFERRLIFGCAFEGFLRFAITFEVSYNCSLGEEEVSTCCLVPLVDGCSHLLLNSTRVSI